MEFIEKIYTTTKEFPPTEMYGLTGQLRRAVISIAMNIAEGSGANSDNEFKRFLNISLRSNYEIMCGLEVSQRLNYIRREEMEMLLSKSDELSAMITGLKKKLNS